MATNSSIYMLWRSTGTHWDWTRKIVVKSSPSIALLKLHEGDADMTAAGTADHGVSRLFSPQLPLK